MANTDFDADYEESRESGRRAASQNFVASLDSDPEQAARAVKLSEDSGVPASFINTDVEGFEKEHRTALSAGLIRNNRHLQEYLEGDPLVAQLSHDDIGPLDQASESIKKLNKPTELSNWMDYLRPSRLAEQFDPATFARAVTAPGPEGERPFQRPQALFFQDPALMRPKELDFALSHPDLASQLAMRGLGLFEYGTESLSRVTSGLMEMGHEGVSKIMGTQFANDLFGEVERRMTGAEIAGHVSMEGAAGRLGERLAAERPAAPVPLATKSPAEFLKKHGEKLAGLMHSTDVVDVFHGAGEEPPPHIDPLIDKAKEAQIREDLQRLKDAVRDAGATATRERSPDHFARLAELHGPGEIGIDSAEIRRIYGDKVPEDGDGLLGWIPGLDERLRNAEQFGGDVWVDRAQFLAKTEREVVNEIGDGLRLRDGGVTVNETKIGKEPPKPEAEPPAAEGPAGRYRTSEGKTIEVRDAGDGQYMVKTGITESRPGTIDFVNRVLKDEGAERLEAPRPVREKGVEPKQVIADELPAIRGGAGMEPRNYNGDRKITLRLGEAEAGAPRSVEILSDTGKSMGTFKLSEREGALNIDELQINPEHQAFLDPQFLGHSLVKDIKRQLQGAFPKAETITHADGPQVKLQLGEDPQGFRDMLSSLMQPGERVRMHGFERDTTVGEHLRDLYSGAAVSPLTREILDRLTHLVGDVPLHVRHEIPPSREGMPRWGFYKIPGVDAEGKAIGNYIHVMSEAPAYTAVHEAVHPATYQAIEHNPTVRANIERLMDAVDHVTGGAHEKAGHPANYAMTNAHEFAAESLANTRLQQWMAKQEITPALREILGVGDRPKNLWQAFVSYIRKALGLSEDVETLLEHVLRVTETAFVKEPVKVGVERALQMREERAMRELGMAEPAKPLAIKDAVAAAEPAEGMVRLYRGASAKPGGPKWVTTDRKYAERYTTPGLAYSEKAGSFLQYVDVPATDPRVQIPPGQKVHSFEAPTDIADRLQPFYKSAELGMRAEEGPIKEGKAVGVPKSFLEREERLLKELQEKDWKADQKRQAKQIRERLLPEAMARGKELTKQVREEFQNRPDLAVDKFMSEGQVKFDPDHLTAEQKERLPKDYVAKGGMNPDDLAGTLGYTSGDAMVERLAMLTEDRKRSGLDQKAYFNKQLKAEVDKRLNEEFGPKREELLQEYRDHALSDIQMQLTHVETIRKAAELGIEPKFSLDNFKAMAESVIKETPIGEIKSARYLQKAGAIAMKVAEAEQKGNHPEAYRLLQQRQLAQLVAKQAMEYEKARKNFDRMVKGFVKTPTAETAKKIDIPYYNWVQQVLARVGYNIDVAALNGRIMLEDHKTLNDFVAAKHAQLREVNVPDFALDEKWPGSKTLKDLTYREFSDLHDMVKTMKHEGEHEKFLVKGGQQIALDEAIEDITNQIKSIAALPPETLKKARETPVRDVAKGIWWGHITPEAMWDRLDRGNKQGLLHQLLIYPAARAVNAKLAMLREYGKRFNEIDFKDMDKLVENTLFRDPETGQPIEMRRRNMLSVLAYWGNESNRTKLLTGWSKKGPDGWTVSREAAEAWLRKNSRPEDWAEMQKLGGISKDLMKEAQKMSLATTGVPIKTIDIQPFTDPHGFAREGWYSPVEYEAERPSGRAATGANEAERPGYYRVTTDQRYTKERTGKIAPTDLTLDIIPQRMGQMIHDITTRPTAIEMGKILHDERFQRAVNSVYGKAQMDEMRSWLQDMTNQTNVDVAGQKRMNQAVGFLRANIVGNLVGFAPSTVLKHVPTAAINSIAQVGPLNFLKATKELFQTDSATGLRKAKLAYDESQELQGRMHNYADLLRGQGESFQFEQGTIAWLRELHLKLGALPVSFGDYMTTTPVYWAARNDALARGATLEMAIDIGNKAVRDAHGTARLTAQPSVMRTTNEMARMYSSLYGFFSHMLQQQYKLAWKARDLLNGQKPLDIEGHWAPSMLGKFMSYYIIPAVIEELVTPYTNEEKDSWGKKAAKGLAMGLSSSLTVVRDLVRTLINPEQRTGGLMDTIMDTARSVVNDLSGPMSKQKAANLVKDTIALNGILTGTTNATEGNVAEYITRYSQGLERPKGPWDVAVGLRYGKTDKHAHTFEEWWKHTVEGKR